MIKFNCAVFEEDTIEAAVDDLLIEIDVIAPRNGKDDGASMFLTKQDAISFAREILLLAGAEK